MYQNLWEGLRLSMIFLAITHWFSCFWIGFRSEQGSEYIASYIPLNTIKLNPTEILWECFDVYVNAFHFIVTTMSTIGYGDIKPYGKYERLFVIIVEFTVLLIFSLIKYEAFKIWSRRENNVNNLIADYSDNFSTYLERLSRARSFQQGIHLDNEIWDQTLEYLENTLRFSTKAAFKYNTYWK